MGSAPDVQTLLKEARRALRRKDAERAVQAFQQVLTHNESHVEAHEGLATAYFLGKHYKKAIEHFTQITLLSPQKASAFVNIGAVYNRMGEHKKAVDVLRRGIQRDKRSAEAFYNLGIAHRGLNQLSMAVSAYREALRLVPDMAEAHQNLGNVYLDLKNNQQAIMHYTQALEIRPGFERAKRGLAKARGAISKAKEAFGPFGRLVDETTVSAKSVPKAQRQLSELERVDDRDAVHTSAIEIEKFAAIFHALLKDKVEPALLALDRAVAQASELPAVLDSAHQEYQLAIKHCGQIRQTFRRKLLELRAHEELMNTPNLDTRG